MASSLARSPSHHRQTSQTNSVSSSSTVTVQCATSISSRNGTRPTASTFRPQIPHEPALVASSLSLRTLSPSSRKRSSAAYTGSENGNGAKDGFGNLNRWSQSTTSSKSSATHNRKGSFSKRLSGSLGAFSSLTNPQTQTPSLLTKVRLSPEEGNQLFQARSPPIKPSTKVPPLNTLSPLSHAVDAASTPSPAEILAPSTADLISDSNLTRGDRDYFGEKWKVTSPPKQRSVGSQSVEVSSTREAALPGRTVQSPGFEASPRSFSTDPAISLYSTLGSSRNHSDRPRRSYHRHTQDRVEPSKANATIEAESSASSVRSLRARTSKRKPPSQKAMLSKALEKANHAVLLDNAQNFEGAMDAYEDACTLLQQAMSRSSTDEDRRKLEAVRNTYSNRIYELRKTDPSFQHADGKALPKPPRIRDSQDQDGLSPVTDDDHQIFFERAVVLNFNGIATTEHRDAEITSDKYVSQRSLSPSTHQVEDEILYASEMAQSLEDRFLRSSDKAYKQQQQQQQNWRQKELSIDQSDGISENSVILEGPMFQQFMPDRMFETPVELGTRIHKPYLLPLLSSSRSRSPLDSPAMTSSPVKESSSPLLSNDTPNQLNHIQQDAVETTSWLDTIDESGGSSSSSVHSRSSSVGLRRKRIRAASGATEAEFDAALDAAVEAAYDDGLEPDDDTDDSRLRDLHSSYNRQGLTALARENIEMAREAVREVEREAAISLAKDQEKRRLQERISSDSIDLTYDDEDEDDEERILEEMTREYILDDSEYNLQSKSALPRQSDSSGFSGGTWISSTGSNSVTAGTSLSRVAEVSNLSSLTAHLQAQSLPPPSYPPPSGALPPPPINSTSLAIRPPSAANKANPGVRDRRLSGAKVKQLKIETNARAVSPASNIPLKEPQPATFPARLPQTIEDLPKSSAAHVMHPQTLPSLGSSPANLTPTTISHKDSLSTGESSIIDITPGIVLATNALSKVASIESENSSLSRPSSPGRFAAKAAGLRKNFSSTSLKTKGLSAYSSEFQDTPPNAPTAQRGVALSVAPALLPLVGNKLGIDKSSAGGIYLFESGYHLLSTPGTPNPSTPNGPQPLEPCPELPLLRPFWFLRRVYQTIANPRGAYLSTKLFVPSSIWRINNVKLKNVEEKVSACDLLSAALLKLAKVDTLDADAIWQEMQSFENIMDQAQNNLSKKLGSEVGVVGATSFFKGSSLTDEGGSTSDFLASKNINLNSKSYLPSWRKLRSKNSVGPVPLHHVTTPISKDGFKEGPIMESLPMTSASDLKSPKSDLSRISYIGPNSNYMAALARLCDAAQILDEIARRVEDPGLKHSSPTHVGLELSMRHAAEFFGFFVCRFIFSDLGLMLDKFIKKGSEWVLG